MDADDIDWNQMLGDSWNVRPAGCPAPAGRFGTGACAIDFGFAEPVPPPFTTIAWRLGQVIVGVLAVATRLTRTSRWPLSCCTSTAN